jgi:hypothetical protein
MTDREHTRTFVVDSSVFLRKQQRLWKTCAEEVTGRLKTLHTEKLHNLYFSTHFTMVIKSRRIIWMGNVVRMREMTISYRILLENPEKKNNLGDRCTDEKIILKWIYNAYRIVIENPTWNRPMRRTVLRRILKKECRKIWTGLFVSLRIGTGGETAERPAAS